MERTYYKISINEKIKAINNKIEQNKTQDNLVRQTAKISDLSSGNVSEYEYEFWTSKDVLPEKDLPEKTAELKRFKYSPLGKELKKHKLILQRNSIKN